MQRKVILFILMLLLFLTSCNTTEKNLTDYLEQYKENYKVRLYKPYEVNVNIKSKRYLTDDDFKIVQNYKAKGILNEYIDYGPETYTKRYMQGYVFKNFILEFNGSYRQNDSFTSGFYKMVSNSDFHYFHEEKINVENEREITSVYTYIPALFSIFKLPSFLIYPDQVGYLKFYENDDKIKTSYYKNQNILNLAYELPLEKDNSDYQEEFPVFEIDYFPFLLVNFMNQKLTFKFSQNVVTSDNFIIENKTKIELLDINDSPIYVVDYNIKMVDTYIETTDIDLSTSIHIIDKNYDYNRLFSELEHIINITEPGYHHK